MFSMHIRPEILKSIREKYPPGTRVEVVEFHDQYRDIPAGTKGRVLGVDDTGTIHCEFENGVSLGALWGIGGFFLFLEAGMTDYFIWNGVDCRQYGIHVSELPPITIPLERSTQTNVPGRPGSLTQLEGEDVYDDMILTATCFISDPAQIPAIAAWLKGSGTVTFANRTGGYYKARIANQIPFEKVLRGNPHCTFAVNFRCYPFFFAEAGDDITVTTSGTIITNPGSVYSEPILTVTGSGNITLMVGTTIAELENISGSIVIDSVLQEAYQGTTLMNDHMNGEFPVLKPGANAISWTGTVTKIVVRPNWRYL